MKNMIWTDPVLIKLSGRQRVVKGGRVLGSTCTGGHSAGHCYNGPAADIRECQIGSYAGLEREEEDCAAGNGGLEPEGCASGNDDSDF